MPQPTGAMNVCLQCGTPHDGQKQFCAKCGAPIAAFAVYGPMETIYAEGFMYRQASKEPRKRIVVVGMWLVMLPLLFGGFAAIFVGLSALGGRESIFLSLLAIAFGLGVLWIPFTLLSRTMANYQPAGEEVAESDEDDDEDLDEDEDAQDRDEPVVSEPDEDDDESWRIPGYGTDAEERLEEGRGDAEPDSVDPPADGDR